MGQSGRSTPGPARVAGEPDGMLVGPEGAARLLCTELGSAPSGLDSSQACGPELGPPAARGGGCSRASYCRRGGPARLSQLLSWPGSSSTAALGLSLPTGQALPSSLVKTLRAGPSSSLICFPSQPAPRCLMSKGSGEAALGSPWGLWEGGRGPRPFRGEGHTSLERQGPQ